VPEIGLLSDVGNLSYIPLRPKTMNSSANPQISLSTLHELVQQLAPQFQFELAGVAPADNNGAPFPELAYFSQWTAEGRAGEMTYLERRNESGELKRSSLQAALPWARSVIVCAANYDSPAPLSIDTAPAGTGWIARYAQTGDADRAPSDYHDVLLARLRAMENSLHENLPAAFTSRSYVDTGPLVERVYARYAGLGWIGKNTCLIHPAEGSWLFLGCIVTSLELASFDLQAALQPDRCGTCTRCIDACPTHALDQPYKMDATRCISYLTIEKRGSIPENLREGIGRQVFGCDICQDVCPWNQKARRTGALQEDKMLRPRPDLINPSLDWLASLTPEDFRRLFRNSPLERTKYRGLQRNVAIAMGNSGDAAYLPHLDGAAHNDAEPAVAEAALWAATRIRANAAAATPNDAAPTN
jgi:epoxyqueuosine reductase